MVETAAPNRRLVAVVILLAKNTKIYGLVMAAVTLTCAVPVPLIRAMVFSMVETVAPNRRLVAVVILLAKNAKIYGLVMAAVTLTCAVAVPLILRMVFSMVETALNGVFEYISNFHLHFVNKMNL